MTRFLPRARKRLSYGFVRPVVFTLVVSLALSLPAVTSATGTTVTATVNSQAYALTFGTVTGAGASSTFTSSQTATIPVTLKLNGMGVSGQSVTWSIVSVDNSENLAVMHNDARGLAWGLSVTPSPSMELSGNSAPVDTNASGEAFIELTDIMGERTVRLKASVSVGGQTKEAELDVTFGKGPLQYFKAPDGATAEWAYSDNTASSRIFPAAAYCGGSVAVGNPFYQNSSWEHDADSGNYYARNSKLPRISQLRAVAANGAWTAAVWPNVWYWSGEVSAGGDSAFVVDISGESPPPGGPQ